MFAVRGWPMLILRAVLLCGLRFTHPLERRSEMRERLEWALVISCTASLFGIAFYKTCVDRLAYKTQFMESCRSEKKQYECDALYMQAVRGTGR